MYERLLDKGAPPAADSIREFVGSGSYAVLLRLERLLDERYQVSRELRFPFGPKYGWGYKYSHKSSHLCYAFFERGAFTVTLQLGDACVLGVEEALPGLSEKARELWKSRYPCGERGGWIHYRVTDESELDDVLKLVKAKKKPARQ